MISFYKLELECDGVRLEKHPFSSFWRVVSVDNGTLVVHYVSSNYTSAFNAFNDATRD